VIRCLLDTWRRMDHALNVTNRHLLIDNNLGVKGQRAAAPQAVLCKLNYRAAQ
jgi:hypothetical protein